MARELKFRQAIFLKGKFHHWHYWGFVGYRDEFIGPITISGIRSEYQIRESQTFTELPDKNGKEIWEGDIVKKGEWIDKVIYGEYYPDDSYYGCNCAFVLGEAENNDLSGELEVIGNIYEHSELLDKTPQQKKKEE